jgi:hypothetical protein
VQREQLPTLHQLARDVVVRLDVEQIPPPAEERRGMIPEDSSSAVTNPGRPGVKRSGSCTATCTSLSLAMSYSQSLAM